MRKSLLILAIALFFCLSLTGKNKELRLINVQSIIGRTEHLEHPIGIDNPAPRFMWRMVDDRQRAAQTTYRVVVGADSLAVARGEGEMWDTGNVSADKM